MSAILIIEDNDTMREGLVQLLEKAGHCVMGVPRGHLGLDLCKKQSFDLVITDYRMEGMNGLEVTRAVKALNEGIDVVLITAYGTIDMAVEAMKLGAADFISKPFSPDEFKLKIGRILKVRQTEADNRRLGEENEYLREQIEIHYNFGEIIGHSKPMQEVFRRIQKVADSDSSILIYGESGTGKELVARAIHFHSPRKDRPFVKVNCGALAEGVLESELFGHERGAFTGAVKRRKGRFELADEGTIFLDEIGEIPLSTQLKLLRVLQEKEIDRVGGEETIQLDVRVIAATNRNLAEQVRQGLFREDLYYRLNIIPIDLPPLRERPEDISDLVAHFLQKKCREMNRLLVVLTPRAMEAMKNYHWPGNVRELENVIERAIVLCERDEIQVSDLPILLDRPEAEDSFKLSREDLALDEALESLEQQLIERAMEKAKGIKTRAASILGIKTSALYYKLEKYGIM